MYVANTLCWFILSLGFDKMYKHGEKLLLHLMYFSVQHIKHIVCPRRRSLPSILSTLLFFKYERDSSHLPASFVRVAWRACAYSPLLTASRAPAAAGEGDRKASHSTFWHENSFVILVLVSELFSFLQVFWLPHEMVLFLFEHFSISIERDKTANSSKHLTWNESQLTSFLFPLFVS